MQVYKDDSHDHLVNVCIVFHLGVITNLLLQTLQRFIKPVKNTPFVTDTFNMVEALMTDHADERDTASTICSGLSCI